MQDINKVNIDETRVENASNHGLMMMEDFWNLSREMIATKVAELTTPDLIDLMLFITEMMANSLPEGSDEQRKALLMHMAARHFIYDPSVFDDCEGLEARLPIFRNVTTAFVSTLANASDNERAGMALRYMGFSAGTIVDVIAAHDAGNSDGIGEALGKDPACKRLNASISTPSEAEWDAYTLDYLQNYVVDPTQEADFSPLPCGLRPLLPPRLDSENAPHWILQYFIRTYAEVLNLIRKRYGYVRRQQLLAAVLKIAEYHIENGYSVEQIPGILARTVLDWDEMCKTRGETPEES